MELDRFLSLWLIFENCFVLESFIGQNHHKGLRSQSCVILSHVRRISINNEYFRILLLLDMALPKRFPENLSQ